MGMNPITTTEAIRDQYIKYLKSMFSLKDPELARQAERLLEGENKFVRGPYVEVTPPFVAAQSIEAMIEDGTLSREFRKLNQNELPVTRPLFMHQEKAIRALVERRRNLIVATGTGSGKTECFLIPIIDYLMKQKQSDGRIPPGVRALLLYPMNALANDQLARLRKLLAPYPDITFGRYTGETEEEESKAVGNFLNTNIGQRRLPNELLSREEMRMAPPHILLTNYAMLEYLLLRPDDNVFFDSIYANNWHFIVLDEAHTYTGAKGSELSMLLSRLKERVVRQGAPPMQCIATSATLGQGKGHYTEVCDFGADIFGEPFEPEDIITADRLTYGSHPFTNRVPYSEYSSLISAFENGQQDIVASRLCTDARVHDMRRILEGTPKLLADIARELYGDEAITQAEKEKALVELVRLCAGIQDSENDLPLLPARYHVFAKALEGAYVALHPDKMIYLDRHKMRNDFPNQSVPVFELANCQRCGQEYIYGKLTDVPGMIYKRLQQGEMHVDELGITNDPADYFLLADHTSGIELDEDALITEALNIDLSSVNDLIEYDLCTACGAVIRSGAGRGTSCCSAPSSKMVRIYGRRSGRGNLHTCFSCGAHSKSIVKRFLSSDDASTEVLAESLYMKVPPNPVTSAEMELNDAETEAENPFTSKRARRAFQTHAIPSEAKAETGRKLLIFSDSRQDAAFFASFLNLKYNQNLWRYSILESLSSLTKKYEEVRLEDLSRTLVEYATSQQIFPMETSLIERKRISNQYLMKEFHALDRKIGLEGLGLVGWHLPKPSNWPRIPKFENILRVDSDGLWAIYTELFNSIRELQGTTYLAETNPVDEFFAPRNRPTHFTLASQGSIPGRSILSWLPAPSYSNRRLDYLKKILRKLEIPEPELEKGARDLLGSLIKMEGLMDYLINECKIMTVEANTQTGAIYRLNHAAWVVKMEPEDLFVCDVCGSLTRQNIHAVCPQYRCEGQLKPYTRTKNRYSYFIDLYRDRQPIPMVAKEHTAQLQSRYALSLQNLFEKGEVNVLSCSTTFEMGVDVGQLEAVFMRNVPPETANYVQRAGRAGRRTSSTAYALTYAKKRSHDLTYYQDPKRIISGKIKTPYIVKQNEKIVLRHIFAVALAWFFRHHEDKFRNVRDFFGFEDGQNAITMLRDELKQQPEDLLAALENIVPGEYNYFNRKDRWGWVGLLLAPESGTLVRAHAVLLDTLTELRRLRDQRYNAGQKTDSIMYVINTYEQKQTIQFLSANNIIPKYGFPVDVVDLEILNDSPDAKSIEISRDLRIALSEFAPGSEIVANGKIWSPYALNKPANMSWPVFNYAICKKCKHVYRYSTALGMPCEHRQEECCNTELHYEFYIEPRFGFSTSMSAPKLPGESRAPRTYTTSVLFEKYGPVFAADSDDETRRTMKTQRIGRNLLQYQYSSNGQLMVFNQGQNHHGFQICERCGFMRPLSIGDLSGGSSRKRSVAEGVQHKRKTGVPCNGTFLHRVHFGYDFMTDVLELRLPPPGPETPKYDNIDLWSSILFALLEGASVSLGIARSEISGCLYHNDSENMNLPSLILYDEVPGGAGHVKRIADKLEDVVYQAAKKVEGQCGCGEETSCYGCIRNYTNQLIHEKLSRGAAYHYLMALQNLQVGARMQAVVQTDKPVPDFNATSTINATPVLNTSTVADPMPVLQTVSGTSDAYAEWSEAIDYASTNSAQTLARYLAGQGLPAPDLIGSELYDERLGVVGEVEFGWNSRRIAILTQSQEAAYNRLMSTGWQVMILDDAAPGAVEAFLRGAEHAR